MNSRPPSSSAPFSGSSSQPSISSATSPGSQMSAPRTPNAIHDGKRSVDNRWSSDKKCLSPDAFSAWTDRPDSTPATLSKSRRVSPTKQASALPHKIKPDASQPTPPPKFPVARLPEVHAHNVRHLLEHFAPPLAPQPPPPPPQDYITSRDSGTVIEYLGTKQALFPEGRLLDRKTPKPRRPHESTASSDTDETRSTPGVYGLTGRGGRARKRARLEGETVSADDAWRWTMAIGRLVKGKARLTPELLGEVSTALNEIEDRSRTSGAFTQAVLEDGLMDMMKSLAEAQDNVYSLEGLRERAKALVSGWMWMMRR